jgi:hypothetical protein
MKINADPDPQHWLMPLENLKETDVSLVIMMYVHRENCREKSLQKII